MEYLSLAIAFALGLLGTLTDAVDKTRTGPLYKRITRSGWIVLGLMLIAASLSFASVALSHRAAAKAAAVAEDRLKKQNLLALASATKGLKLAGVPMLIFHKKIKMEDQKRGQEDKSSKIFNEGVKLFDFGDGVETQIEVAFDDYSKAQIQAERNPGIEGTKPHVLDPLPEELNHVFLLKSLPALDVQTFIFDCLPDQEIGTITFTDGDAEKAHGAELLKRIVDGQWEVSLRVYVADGKAKAKPDDPANRSRVFLSVPVDVIQSKEGEGKLAFKTGYAYLDSFRVFPD